MRSLVALVATSALMVAGLAFVAVSPASAAGTLTFSASIPTQTAGAGFNFVVNVAPTPAGDTINITSTCTLNPANPSEVTDGSGNATFTGVYVKLGSTCTLTATDVTSPNNGATVQSNSFTVNAAGESKLVYTPAPPVTGTVGVTLTQFKVSVEDTYGNVTSSGDTITLTSPTAGCVIAGNDAGAASSGVATFSAVDFTSGSACAVLATDTSNGSVTTVTSTVTLATTTPAEVGFTPQPALTVAAGAVLPSFAVSVEESNGIPITSGTGSTDVITLTSTCTLSGTTSVAAVGGVATFAALTIKTGSSCQLVATDTTRVLAVATSTVILVTAGAATQVVFTTAPPATETTASTILATFRASVEDANGNVETTGLGSSDTIAITSTCALGGTTTAAAFAGVATFSALSINATGACVLTATDSSRTLTAATHTTSVGTPQAAVTVRTLKGTAGATLRLAIAGGTGTGAVTWTLAAGSTAVCTLTGNALTARRAGACTVTATKAGDTTYIAASSPATKVTFILPFKAYRVIGAVFPGRTNRATITGSGFYGRPRVISNVGGISTRVIRDTGHALVVFIFVGGGVRPGVHAFTIILANGKRTAVRYSLR